MSRFKVILLAFTTMLIFHKSVAQNQLKREVNKTVVDQRGFIKDLPMAPPNTVGTTYIFDEWMSGQLVLINDNMLEDVSMRYDLEKAVLEIKYREEIKICPAEKIKQFSLKWLNDNGELIFVNTTYIENSTEGNPRKVMSRLFSGEEVGVYKEYYTYIKKGNYVPSLDIGERDSKILIKNNYFILFDGAFNEWKPALKKNKSLFGNHYAKVDAYSKDNKLKLKNEEDIVKLMKFYQSLL